MILEYWKRISFWKSWNALKCPTKVDLKHFLWSFFDYCSSTAAFSKIFSVAEVPAGWAEYQNQYAGIVEQFYYIFSKPFPVLWLYQQTQQSSKYFALYEELGNSVLVLPMVTPLRSETELLGGSQLWPLNGSSGKAPSPRFASSLTGVQPQHSGFWLKALIK